MEDSLVVTWILTIVLRFIGIILFPAIITIAAVKLWGIVHPWIPAVFLVNAVVGVFNSLPSILISMNMLTVQHYSEIAFAIAIIASITHLMFGVACLGLAITVRKRW